MKLVYLKAMGNIRHNLVFQLLSPIIRGEISITDHPDRIRYHSISAIKKSLVLDGSHRSNKMYELLWPVLTNTSLPLQIRMEAYDVVFTMHQTPTMRRMMSVYWLMVYEKNEHLYNYHYTNLKSLANSVDPCMRPTSEMARKLLKFTRVRNVRHHELSSKIVMGYYDSKYQHGLTVKTALQLNELSGLPQGFKLFLYGNVGRKPFQIGAVSFWICSQLLV